MYKTKNIFKLEDFSKYDGEFFVKYAYMGILKRMADKLELNIMLESLLLGNQTKEQVINNLLTSEECRNKDIKIIGL